MFVRAGVWNGGPVRSNVMNKLSHAGTVNLVKAQVQEALDLMPRLKAALEKPTTP